MKERGWGGGGVMTRMGCGDGRRGMRGCVAFEMGMQKRVCGSLTIHFSQQLWLCVILSQALS